VDRSLVAFDLLHGRPSTRRDRQRRAACAVAGAGAYAATCCSPSRVRRGMFAYLEDVELGIRLRMAGARCAVAPTIRVARAQRVLGSGSARKNERWDTAAGHRWKYRRDLSAAARLRGHVIDVVVYGGQVAIDHNAGAVRGRAKSAANVPAAGRPVRTTGSRASRVSHCPRAPAAPQARAPPYRSAA